MPIRTNRVSKKNLRIGMHVFVAGFFWAPRRYEPVKLQILSMPDPTDLDAITVRVILIKGQDKHYRTKNKNGDAILFPGDMGMRPWNYDQRPTQVFTTRAACEKAIKEWGGRNPNFLVGK